ncbi:HNH endonuclease signature motif containing protein [Pseudohongiella nitratireducens]|uniref:HNH endonuclease signature motif containing protein n=1 Tax=Pseudohongiella nitratireducens TaxID=1768907 RepID=UPI0030EE7B16|tara:strand:+ start:961 stop:1755 length:795 start_codon:yes stop_codon:yes gene_type:complete
MPRKVWTQPMLKRLKKHYQDHSYQHCTKLINDEFGTDWTHAQVHRAIRNHKIRTRRVTGEILRGRSRLFTPEQVDFITTNYKWLSRKAMVVALKNVYDLEVTERQVVAFVKNHKIKSGRSGHFKKGLKPHNTGTKGVMKANSGSFKKGQVHPNQVPIGTVSRTTRDEYLKRKVAQPNTWVFVHIDTWEKHHGPIPDGYVVSFIDGDRENCDISNLELISRSVLAIRNKLGWSHVPAELKPTVTNLAKMKAAAGQAKRRAKEHAA